MDHEFFRWTWTGVSEIGLVMIVWLILILTDKMPPIASVSTPSTTKETTPAFSGAVPIR